MVISKAANLSAQYEKPFLGEAVLFQRFRASMLSSRLQLVKNKDGA